MRHSTPVGIVMFAVAVLFGSSAKACDPEAKNILSLSSPDTVFTCPAGDSVKAGRPSRIRVVIKYTHPPCNSPKVGVPPESIWVQATPLEGGNVLVWDQPLKIFADDSTDADGNARITLPSVSGCGALRVTVYVDGIAQDSMAVEVRSLDSDSNGEVTSADVSSVCDVDFDGDIDSHDTTVLSNVPISGHYGHWHRFALFGTLKRAGIPGGPNS